MTRHIKAATVDDLIAGLTELSNRGYGAYPVRCNEEYWVAQNIDGELNTHINEANTIIEVGGHDAYHVS